MLKGKIAGCFYMGFFKKTGNQLPDIIYTLIFQLANGSRYLTYTERREAVKNENNVNPEQTLEENSGNLQIDPDVPKNYQGYLGYTDRKAATKLEKGVHDRYPTFTGQSLNINEKQHQQLIDNLKLAKKNGAILWSGVVSFDPEFLERIGVYNPETKAVDQRKIKQAIQKAVPLLLKKEGLNVPETFWWGDVHLNTNHVHVHLGISQTKNTRPLKENGEPIGLFRQKSLRSMKMAAHRELIPSKERQREIALERDLGTIRQDLRENIEYLVRHDQVQRQMVQQIYWALPRYKDLRKWRASNHRTDFHTARELVADLVDDALNTNLKDQYDKFKTDLQVKDQNSRNNYGQSIHDTVVKNDKRLKQYLMNRVFDYMREIDQISEDESSILDQVQASSPELNQKLIDIEKAQLKALKPKSKEAKQLRQKLGYRRHALKEHNLKTTREYLLNKLAAVNQSAESNSVAKQWLIQTLKERLELNRLTQIPFKERKAQGLNQRYQQLSNQYVDVTKIPINQVNEHLVKVRKNQLAKELGVIMESHGDPLQTKLLPNPKSEYGIRNAVEYYRIQQEVLDFKLAIKNNNDKYKQNKDERNQANRPLFKALKRDYSFLADSKRLDRKIAWDTKVDQRFDKWQQRQAVHPNKISYPTSRLAPIQTIEKGFKDFLSSMARNAENRSRANRQARRRALDDGDDLEKTDREEELENRIEH